MLQADSVATAAKLALVWLFAVFSSALGARLLAAGILADSRSDTDTDTHSDNDSHSDTQQPRAEGRAS